MKQNTIGVEWGIGWGMEVRGVGDGRVAWSKETMNMKCHLSNLIFHVH